MKEAELVRRRELVTLTCTRRNPTDFKLAAIQVPHWAIHSSRFSGQSNSVTISPPDLVWDSCINVEDYVEVVADSSLHSFPLVAWLLAQLGLAPWRPNNSPHSHPR